MKDEFYKQVNELFIKHPNEKDEYVDLYEFITLVLKSRDLQEQAN